MRPTFFALVRFDLSEKPETSKVDAEYWYATRRCDASAMQKRAVTAERHQQGCVLDMARCLGDRAVARDLDRLNPASLQRRDGAVDCGLLRARSAQDAYVHGDTGSRCTKISRLPSAPATSEGASAFTA